MSLLTCGPPDVQFCLEQTLIGPQGAFTASLPPNPLCCPVLPRRPQSHARIPDDAWEYQIRKSLNDAAYNGLDYVPYCSTMPVQPRDDNPKWIWKKKAAK